MTEYKDISDLKKQISDFKKAVHSPNGDYLTGYVCALSAVEGIIAGLPDSDVVEVVRCKDCQWFNTPGCAIHIVDDSDKPKENDFCSFGERKNRWPNK